MDNRQQIIEATGEWLEHLVIGLNLCPFARYVVDHQQLRYSVIDSDDKDVLLQALINELELLDTEPNTETTLLVHPNVLQSFDDYLEFLNVVDLLLEDRHYEGVYQVASFHPDYQFNGTSSQDPANYTNRSPYPMLHILREESVSRAIDSHPDIDAVPEANIELLRTLGLNAIKARLTRGYKPN